MKQRSVAVVLSILFILSLNIRCLCVLVSHLNSHFLSTLTLFCYIIREVSFTSRNLRNPE